MASISFYGSSPFVAAPQFGHRARLYQLDLYNNPENILEIIQMVKPKRQLFH
jgi:hypothetical protein